ncbi:MAG: SpoIID/LytB domain-containing protein [Bacteroidetes bacterium]|nr:SpoIID/LytB domain-containing protein [Bacteroidota bacterium]
MKTKLIAFLGILFLLAGIPELVKPQSIFEVMKLGQDPVIRILLYKGTIPQKITLPTGSEVFTSIGVRRITPQTQCLVALKGNSISLTVGDNKFVSSDSLSIKIPSTETFLLDGNEYHGSLILHYSNNELLVVNHVDLESYLQSVIPTEIGQGRKKQDLESVKVQAIAARTFTYGKILSKKASIGKYDLLPTVMDQAYFGTKSENNTYRVAIAATNGMVGVFDSTLIEALYHSTCGGLTENSESVWGGNKISYLQSVYCGDDTSSFCGASPFFNWERIVDMKRHNTFFFRQIIKYVEKNPAHPIFKNKTTEKIEISGRDSSGRVLGLRIINGSGAEVLAQGDYLRWLFPDSTGKILSSVWFDLETIRSDSGELEQVHFKGRGYGHGLGICQWGAVGMSRRGYTYDQIFRFYYRGARIVKLY